MVLDLADGGEAGVDERLLGHGAHPAQDAHGQRTEECGLAGFADEGEAIWFLMVARDLCQQLVCCDADGRRQTALTKDR